MSTRTMDSWRIASLLIVSLALFAPLASGADNTPMTLEQAAALALESVPGGKVIHSRSDYDDGRDIFEIVVLDAKYVYEIEVDPQLGRITQTEQEAILRNSTAMTPAMEQAKTKALEASGGGEVIKIEEDSESGARIYEIDIIKDGVKHEIDIDAASGEILDHDKEFLD